MPSPWKSLAAALALAAPAFAADPAPPPPQKEVDPQVEVKPQDRPVLEVAFVLDTTGSMGGLLEGAKQKVWSIASRMASGKPTPRIRVGLVAYRDRGDAYVTKRFDLTEDLDAVYTELRSFQAAGGGDGPEHVAQGLADAVSKLTWTTQGKAAKMIFLVGDMPSHDYGDGVTTAVWAKKAVEQGIVVNTIQCGSYPETAKEFASLSKLADGSFASIGQTGNVVVVATPFDADLAKVSGEVAANALVGGSGAAKHAAAEGYAALRAMPATSAADRLSTRGKMAPSKAPARGDGMLVDLKGAVDLADAPALLGTMKEDELPAAVQAIKPAERAAFVEKQSNEQKQRQEKLNTLSKQRDEWLTKNAKNSKDSFDERVFESVKKKAESVGVAY